MTENKKKLSSRWWQLIYSSGSWATGIALILGSVLIVAYENRYRHAVRDEIQTKMVNDQEVVASVAAERLGSYVTGVTAKLRLISQQAVASGSGSSSHETLARIARYDIDRNWVAGIYIVGRDFDKVRKPRQVFRFDDDVPAGRDDAGPAEGRETLEYDEIVAHLRNYEEQPEATCYISRTLKLSNGRQGQVLTVPTRDAAGNLVGLVAALLPVSFEVDQLKVSAADSGKSLWIYTSNQELLGDHFGPTPAAEEVAQLVVAGLRDTTRTDRWVLTIWPVSHGVGRPWTLVVATRKDSFDRSVKARLGGPWTRSLLITLACGNFVGLCLLLTLRHWREQVAVFRVQAERDTLTKVYSRRFLDREANVLCQRFEKLGVLMVDLNDFKHCNDTLGHPTGDYMLVEAAKLLSDSLRQKDLVIRIGGDEFLLLLPMADQQMVAAIASRIGEAVEQWNLNNARPGIEISLALGQAAGNSSDLLLLIELADRRMYDDKARFKKEKRTSVTV
ncbi:MAG: diguanylate cyclase [Anaerolineaceae bacterium]|nr:diguanylate cyclase [Anaerolineaceae bacterium]